MRGHPGELARELLPLHPGSSRAESSVRPRTTIDTCNFQMISVIKNARMTRATQTLFAPTDRDIAIIAMVFSYGGCGVRHPTDPSLPGSPGVLARPATHAFLNWRLLAISKCQAPFRLRAGRAAGPLFLTTGIRSRPLLGLSTSPYRPLHDAADSHGPKRRIILGHDQLATADFRVALEIAVEQSLKLRQRRIGHPRVGITPPIPEGPRPRGQPTHPVDCRWSVLTLTASRRFRLSVSYSGARHGNRAR